MLLMLPDSGVKVKVWVEFSSINRKKKIYRNTKITLSNDAGEVLASGESSCSPKDHFSRLLGRKLAVQDMFKRYWLSTAILRTKQDRRTVFEAICAQFKLRAAKGRRGRVGKTQTGG